MTWPTEHVFSKSESLQKLVGMTYAILYVLGASYMCVKSITEGFGRISLDTSEG